MNNMLLKGIKVQANNQKQNEIKQINYFPIKNFFNDDTDSIEQKINQSSVILKNL